MKKLTEADKWRFLAEEKLKEEAENPYQETIDWLTYDLEHALDDDKIEIMADIRYYEWLGDGNNTVGIKLKYGKISPKSEDSLIRRKMEADYYFAITYNDQIFDFAPYIDKGSSGFTYVNPFKFSEKLQEQYRTLYSNNPDVRKRAVKKYRNKNRYKVNEAQRLYRKRRKDER